MRLSPIEKLSTNCPRCFGHHNESKKANEPDYIVCIDGNFQQRRHKEASVEISQIEVQYPNLFLTPNQVQKWENRNGVSSNNSLVRFPLLSMHHILHLATQIELLLHVCTQDPCTQMHTTANDSRSTSTWRACDDTGLLGMVCRHDHALKFINIVQSGEKYVTIYSLQNPVFQKTQ